MSTRICLIIEINAVKRKITINKNETNLLQLKQKIIEKFRNINLTNFNIIDDDECVIDDEDIELFGEKTRLFVKFISEWSCTKCRFINKNTENQCGICQTLKNSDHDNIEHDIDDLDDGEQEVLVNENDLREKAFGCCIKEENIIACIGKIRSTYIKSDGSSLTSVGTGTVYKVVGSYGYVITCAHNVRFTEYFDCNDCRKKNKTRKCSKCKSLNSTAHILKAGKVYFQRRKLENGGIEQEYKFNKDIVYIDDSKYAELPLVKSGYDIAILRFKDTNNYYKHVCKNILLVDGKLFHNIRGKHAYYIYGYPLIVFKKPMDELKQREAMWGAESINDIFECELNQYGNGKYVLKQSEIDASGGTSGAAIFSIYAKYTLIFAVHTGGSKKYKYNAGTLCAKTLTAQHSTIKNVDDLIMATLQTDIHYSPENTVDDPSKNNSETFGGRGPKQKKSKKWNDKAMIEWSAKDVKSWIESMASYKKYASAFPQYIDGRELLNYLNTTNDDLTLIIPKKLWRKRFMEKLKLAKTHYAQTKTLSNDACDDEKGSPTKQATNKGAVNGIVGLRNLGNTCFMNTSIQILSQSPYITRYLSKRAKLSKTNGGGTVNWVYNKYNNARSYVYGNNADDSMLNAWTELCDIIYNQQRSHSYSKTLSPANIRDALTKMDKNFGSGRQDDASRSLDYMLQALDEQIEQEINSKKKIKTGHDIIYKDNIQIFHGRTLTELGQEEQRHIGELLRDHNPNNSILRKSFDGIERIICQCLECNKIFQQYATLRIVDLSVISHEIVLRNINIVTNNHCYQLPQTSMLQHCSLNLIKYHVGQYLSSQCQHADNHNYENMKIVTISAKNGKVQCINKANCKLSELQSNDCIFVLVSNKPKHQCHKSGVLQFNLSVGQTNNQLQITQLSVKYNDYNPNVSSLHQLINNEIKQQENNNCDDVEEKYDYYIDYDGHISYYNRNEPNQPIGGAYGRIDVLILLRVHRKNKDYDDILKDDKFITFEARERYSERYPERYYSPLAPLEKFRKWWSYRKTNCKDIQCEIDSKLAKIRQSIQAFQKKANILNALNAWICNKYKLIIMANHRNLTSLKQCLSEYEKAKLFDDTCYAHPCPHCNTGSNSQWIKVRKTIVCSPPILLFHLDRFGKNIQSNYGRHKGGRYSKSNGRNKFEHAINYELQSDFERATKQMYNLFGVSNHYGSTDGGHYTATVKCLSDGNWYEISDSYVYTGSKQQALRHSESATILAYVRDMQ